MKKEEEAVAASMATKSTKSNLIYGDLHLPPLPHLWLRPPELHEAEQEDDAVPDPAAGICHLPPGIKVICHVGPNTKPNTTTIYSDAISSPSR
jgi:hypothetical protein